MSTAKDFEVVTEVQMVVSYEYIDSTRTEMRVELPNKYFNDKSNKSTWTEIFFNGYKQAVKKMTEWVKNGERREEKNYEFLEDPSFTVAVRFSVYVQGYETVEEYNRSTWAYGRSYEEIKIPYYALIASSTLNKLIKDVFDNLLEGGFAEYEKNAEEKVSELLQRLEEEGAEKIN